MWHIIIPVTQSVQKINNKYEDNIVSGGLFLQQPTFKGSYYSMCIVYTEPCWKILCSSFLLDLLN